MKEQITNNGMSSTATKEYVKLNGTDLTTILSDSAKHHLIDSIYTEIIEDESTRIWFRYPSVVEMICNKIALVLDTTSSQVFIAGITYDNAYCGTLIIKRLADARSDAGKSDNMYRRSLVFKDSNRFDLYEGRVKKFRINKDVFKTLSKEAKNANLRLSDLGLLRFYCWYKDISGQDEDLVSLNELPEFKTAKRNMDDSFVSLVDYTKFLEGDK